MEKGYKKNEGEGGQWAKVLARQGDFAPRTDMWQERINSYLKVLRTPHVQCGIHAKTHTYVLNKCKFQE